jgi:hypothetical protein
MAFRRGLLRLRRPTNVARGTLVEKAPSMTAEETEGLSDTPLDYNEMSRAENYRPRYRPRNIAMPVDPEARIDDAKYPTSALQQIAAQVQALRQEAKERGAVKLAEVPKERTVADAFRFCVGRCRDQGWLRVDASTESTTLLHPGPRDYSATVPIELPSSGLSAYAAPARVHSSELASTGASRSIELFNDQLLQLLDRTSLSSPVHGGLACEGSALVHDVIAADAFRQFPRLRSRHVATIQHLAAGLLPCCRVAQSVGLVTAAELDVDVGMWRELNHLTLHRRWAQQMLVHHGEKANLHMAGRRTLYYKKHVAATRQLARRFPATQEQLQPRIEWVRDLLFAFIAFIARTRTEAAASTLVRRLFCPELAYGVAGSSTAAFAAQHPLNQIAEMRALAASSTSGEFGATLYSDRELQDDLSRFAAVPPIVVQAVRPQHALREAQLLLAYDPSIPAEWRDAPIDFEVEFLSAEVQDNADPHEAVVAGKFRRNEARLLRVRMVLGAARRIVGIGHGATEREAMDAAARHMVQGFYLRRFRSAEPTPAAGE